MAATEYQSLGQLMVKICRLHATKADQLMDQIGLYRGQAVLLMALSEHDGVTHSEIAEKLMISPAAATKVIKRLEQAEYLQRQTDPDDERVSRVFLQDKGHAIIDGIDHSFERLDRALFDGLTGPDLNRFRGTLTHMQANLLRFQPGPEEEPAQP